MTPNAGADPSFDAAVAAVETLEARIAACLVAAQRVLGSKVPPRARLTVQCKAKFYNPSNCNEKYQIEIPADVAGVPAAWNLRSSTQVSAAGVLTGRT